MGMDTTGTDTAGMGASGAERVTRTLRPDGTYDVDGERDARVASCPDCGAAIALTQDVFAYDAATGAVTAWGPAVGECPRCGVTLVDGDSGDGQRVLRPAPVQSRPR